MLNKGIVGVAAVTMVSLCAVQGILHAGKEGGNANITPVYSEKSSEGIQGVASTSKKTDEATRLRVLETYGKLPLSFIQNDGQMDKRVRYYEKGAGHATYFTQRGVYLSLVGGRTNVPFVNKQHCKEQADEAISKSETCSEQRGTIGNPKSENQNPHPSTGNSQLSTPQLVKLIPLGANKNPEIVAEGQQEGKVNYFIGNDSSKWKTNIPMYKAVVYKDIYKDIDMKFYGNNRQMEYDIIVKPGANPSRVQFLYEGIEALRVNEDGDLEIVVGKGETETHPMVGQASSPDIMVTSGDACPTNKGDLFNPSHDKGDLREPTFTKENFRKGGTDKRSLSVLSAEDKTLNHGNDGLSIDTEKARETKERTIIQKKPYVYQVINGKKVEREGRFRVLSSVSEVQNPKSEILNPQFVYGFTVASYDKHYPLVIDPTLSYSTYLGDTYACDGISYGIAVDGDGDVYITSSEQYMNFQTREPMSGRYAFMQKMVLLPISLQKLE